MRPLPRRQTSSLICFLSVTMILFKVEFSTAQSTDTVPAISITPSISSLPSLMPSGSSQSNTTQPTGPSIPSPMTAVPFVVPTLEPSDPMSTYPPSLSPVTSPPTNDPTLEPTDRTTDSPITRNPTNPPTPRPTPDPTPPPTSQATSRPTTLAPTSEEPTLNPTVKPTLESTIKPTEEPTQSPVLLPTTLAPSLSPQETPTTLEPSSSPTKHPSDQPTVTPTEETPTPSNSGKPSSEPSLSPTVSLPSTTPTFHPSLNPSVEPSIGSSNVPSIASSLSPSNTPSEPITEQPSVQNTGIPTFSPTEILKSTRPTSKLMGPTTVTNLKMILSGIVSLPNGSEWAKATGYYFQEWYNDSSDDPLSVQYNLYDTVVKIDLVSSGPESRNLLSQIRRRALQSSSVEVTYTQTTIYRTKDSDIDIYDIVKAPLNDQASRDTYVRALKEMDGYEDLTDVSPVSLPSDDESTEQVVDRGEDAGGLSKGAIIGIACGSAAALILLVGAFVLMRRRGEKDSDSGDGRTSTQSNTVTPEPQLSAATLPTYGDQSVATVDYDYSKAYGGAGNYSLSDAGGTLGSRTRQTAADQTLIPGSGGTIFSDDNTFDQAYEGVREELLDIYAPPGKLGVVIDTPNDGPPVVHAVKDSSIIADKVKVGDKLVAVDDEDVRDMTAIKVSKLISRKSTNASRKLTVIRNVAE